MTVVYDPSSDNYDADQVFRSKACQQWHLSARPTTSCNRGCSNCSHLRKKVTCQLLHSLGFWRVAHLQSPNV